MARGEPRPSFDKETILAQGNLPRHVAVIMDGNGRWATRRGLPRIAGHHAGRRGVREAVEGASALGIEVLTLYTFSVENWHRPAAEVTGQVALELFPSSDTRFFDNEVDAELQFEIGADGRASRLEVFQDGEETPAQRTK
jgi:undecaprenyl diphosphate synthase